jgi:chromosome partitioning protein
MQTKVIVVTNRKGGVGKTTVAVHLAAGLSLAGRRVAIIDTDSQGHCAVYFNMPKENGLFQLFGGDATLTNVLRIIPREGYWNDGMPEIAHELYLLPGAKQTSSIPTMDGYDATYFRQICDEMGELLGLDYIVVDTGPTSNLFDGAVQFAANYMLYVTEASSLSFDGLNASMKELERAVKRQNEYRVHKAEILAIVVNKWRGNTAIQRHQTAELTQAFPSQVVAPIPQATVWQEACDFKQTIFAFAPQSKESAQAWRLVKQILSKVEASDAP